MYIYFDNINVSNNIQAKKTTKFRVKKIVFLINIYILALC